MMHSATLQDDVFSVSGIELSRRVKEKEITARQLLDTYISRMEEVNPRLNALVANDFERARRAADEADASASAEGAFFGVPCTIKESFAMKGMPNSSGLVTRKDLRSEKDAITVQRVRKSGAIPMGVTNVSELCMWMETFNHVYGRTNNPYNTAHIAGGSSGGEGAIIGSGASPFGLGSDIGGSIRMPAFFNGVFGHKPTGGAVPNSGQFPIAEKEALRYQCAGPICRKAEDLWPLFQILTGPDGQGRECRNFKFGEPNKAALETRRVFVIESNHHPLVTPVNEDIKNALNRAAKSFEKLGCKVERIQLPLLKKSFNIWSAMVGHANETSFRELMSNGGHYNPFKELIPSVLGLSKFTVPANAFSILDEITRISPALTESWQADGDNLKKNLTDLLRDGSLLLYPSYPSAAPKHNEPLLRPIDWVYTGIFNVLELPVTQVPMGLNSVGLPTGLQVAAIHGADHLTIAAAMYLEKEHGGWVAPII